MTFPVLFKVAILIKIRSKIQKGAVGEPDHERVTKADVFRHQLAKDRLQVNTLTDNWCKLEGLSYLTIIMLN